jgi:hypothetical protein
MIDPDTRQRAASLVSSFMQDAAALTGAALITYGANLAYHPAGPIVGGLFLLGGAWLAARKSG